MGLDLGDATSIIPISAGCKACKQPTFPRRTFPSIGRTLAIDSNQDRFAPYPAA